MTCPICSFPPSDKPGIASCKCGRLVVFSDGVWFTYDKGRGMRLSVIRGVVLMDGIPGSQVPVPDPDRELIFIQAVKDAMTEEVLRS